MEKKQNKGWWSEEENTRYLLAMTMWFRTWAERSQFIGTRSPAQVKSHDQKMREKMERYRASGGRCIPRREHSLQLDPLHLEAPAALTPWCLDANPTVIETGSPCGAMNDPSEFNGSFPTSEATGDEAVPDLSDIVDTNDDDDDDALYAADEVDENTVASAEGYEMLDDDDEEEY